MTIITSQEEFKERLHRAKLDVVQGRTYPSFEEVLNIIKSRRIKNKSIFIKNEELCIK